MFTLLLWLFISCSSDQITDRTLFPDENNSAEFVESSSSIKIFKKKRNRHSIDTTTLRRITNSDGIQITIDTNDNPIFIPELLPNRYINRDFLTITNTRDVNDLTGGIAMLVEDNDDFREFRLAYLDRFAKDTELPEIVQIDDGVLYSQKINQNVEFNGSFLIAEASGSNERLKEVTITDVARSNVALGQFDITRLKAYYDTQSEEKKNNLYIIKSVTITAITTTDYNKTSIDGDVSGNFFKVNGSWYSGDENFKSSRTISLDVIPLKDVFN